MKKLLLVVLAIAVLFCLAACGEKKEAPATSGEEVVVSGNAVEEVVNVPKEEQIGTAGSNMPLKDNLERAKHEIEIAMGYLLEKAYSGDVVDARYKDIKVYTAEEEQANEVLKDYNLGSDEVAFEISYELKPREGVDPRQFTAGTGDYDEESGWVVEKYNVGILRPIDGGEQKFEITNFGTGF